VDLPFLRLLLNYKQKFHLSIHSITNVFSERNDIDRAAIVIAHRLSTIRIADQILVIEDGKSWNAAPTTTCRPATAATVRYTNGRRGFDVGLGVRTLVRQQFA